MKCESSDFHFFYLIYHAILGLDYLAIQHAYDDETRS